MHEMALCESMLQIIEREAARQNFSRVRKVRLEVGALAGVEKQAMLFGFEVVRRGTVADGAELEIIELPGRGWCMACAKEVEVKSRLDACPECGGFQVQITGGDELRIRDLEVD